MHIVLLVLFLEYFIGISNAEQNTYRAAVLEYPPITDGASKIENWEDNLKEILHFIRDAANQKAQIIVLPEDALSGTQLTYEDLEVLSTEIPDYTKHVLPCTSYNEYNFSSTLRDLSCAAKTHRIYVVANLIEKEIDKIHNKAIYYNTNIVFNRNGEILARYRKIHLFNEALSGTGNEIVTFTTDFGVTFGVFICFDIVFDLPARKVLEQYNVTDIVLSEAWFSILPFYHSLSVQHAYAKANGVNLLASGLNNPSSASGGSGIYLADGRIAETFISGTPLSKLIIQDVPKIASKIPNSSCKLQRSSGSYEWGVDPITGNISGFHTIQNDMSNYTFKPLNLLDQREILETICSGSSKFCCTFNISSTRTHNVQPNYTYKLAAFQGTWQPTSTSGTTGIRNCGIVACLNDDTSTCGDRKVVPPHGITFEKISVKATADNKGVLYQPITLTFDLKPATDYTFCALENGHDKVDLTMETTESQDALLTFAIVGRVFIYDNLPFGVINSANGIKCSEYFIFVTVFVSLLVTKKIF